MYDPSQNFEKHELNSLGAMEYDLETLIQQNIETISKEEIIAKVLCGVHFIHSAGIVHRDLNPSNILLDSEGNVRICDFGSATELSSLGPSTPFVGAGDYRAPELLMGQPYGLESKTLDHVVSRTMLTRVADIWAVGCIMAYMIEGMHPLWTEHQKDYEWRSDRDQLEAILRKVGTANITPIRYHGDYKWIVSFYSLCDLPLGCSPLLSMMQFEKQQRPKALELLDDDFFDGVRDKLEVRECEKFIFAKEDLFQIVKHDGLAGYLVHLNTYPKR